MCKRIFLSITNVLASQNHKQNVACIKFYSAAKWPCNECRKDNANSKNTLDQIKGF